MGLEQSEPPLLVHPPPAYPGVVQNLMKTRRPERAGEDQDRERVGATEAGEAGGRLALGQNVGLQSAWREHFSRSGMCGEADRHRV